MDTLAPRIALLIGLGIVAAALVAALLPTLAGIGTAFTLLK